MTKKFKFTGVIDVTGDLVSKSCKDGVPHRFICKSLLKDKGGIEGFREGFKMTVEVIFLNGPVILNYRSGYAGLIGINVIRLLETH